MWEIWAKGALLLQSPKLKPGPGASVVKPGVYSYKEKRAFPSRTLITITLHQDLARELLSALPSHPPGEGSVSLSRISSLSPPKAGWVTWFLSRFLCPLPASYFKSFIKTTLPSLPWYGFFLQHSKLNNFNHGKMQLRYPVQVWGAILAPALLGPQWRRADTPCLHPFSLRLASQPW